LIHHWFTIDPPRFRGYGAALDGLAAPRLGGQRSDQGQGLVRELGAGGT